MINQSPSNWMRFIRCMIFSVAMAALLATVSPFVLAADGPIYVLGKKLDHLYRFKQGVKYLPIEDTSRALGFEAVKKDGVWSIKNTWQGEICVNEHSSRVLKRDNVDFVTVDFWMDTVGVEIVERGESVYVLNRIIDVTEREDGLLFKTAVPLDYTTFMLDNPPRTVFDFKHLSTGNEKGELKYSVPGSKNISIRIGQFESFPHVGRLVIDQGASPDITLQTGVYGGMGNLFWMGRGAYSQAKPHTDSVERETVYPADNLIAIGNSGNVLISGLKFSSVKKSMLLDKVPIRAVFDLMDCSVLFKEHRVYEGRGETQTVRIYGHEDDFVRVVVEFSDFRNIEHEITSDGDLHIFYVESGYKSNLRVLIDPGHGGKDPGAIVTKDKMGGLSAQEKDINLLLSRVLGQILAERGVEVYYTRTDDRFIDLKERRDMTTRLGVDLFVSIHANSTPLHPQTFASGPEVYYHYSRDKQLAQNIWQHMSWRTGLPGRGIFFCRFVVTMNPNIPSVLVETGYMNNPHDLALLLDTTGTFQRNAMLGVADGIIKSFPDKFVPVSSSQQRIERPVIERQIEEPDDETEVPYDRHRPRTGFRDRYSSLELSHLEDFPSSLNLLSRGDSNLRRDNVFQLNSSDDNANQENQRNYSARELLTLSSIDPIEKPSVSQIDNNPEFAKNIVTKSEVKIKAQEAKREKEEETVKDEWDKSEIEKMRNNIFKLGG